MSTRSSLGYAEVRDRTYHLFSEAGDYWHVYLEVEAPEGEFCLRIPLDAWRELRKEHWNEKYLDMSREERRTAGREWAEKRIADWEASGRSNIEGLAGSAIYSVTEPLDKQIEAWVRWHTPPWGK